MYIHVYIYIHIWFIYIYIHVFIYNIVYICMYMYSRVCRSPTAASRSTFPTESRDHVLIYVWIYVFKYIWNSVDVYVYSRMHRTQSATCSPNTSPTCSRRISRSRIYIYTHVYIIWQIYIYIFVYIAGCIIPQQQPHASPLQPTAAESRDHARHRHELRFDVAGRVCTWRFSGSGSVLYTVCMIDSYILSVLYTVCMID